MDGVQVNECKDPGCQLQQSCFRFQKESDGSILTVHHTINEDNKIIRVRFVKFCFSDDNKYFISVDHRGNLFIFDLIAKRTWKWTEKIPNCSVIRNIPQSPLAYVIGTKCGQIIIINIRKPGIIRQKKFSNYPIEGISFSAIHKTEISFLIYSSHEAILIRLDSLEQSHRLEYNENKISIRQISIIPNSDKIFAWFSDDSVHIWSGASLNTIRIIHPIRMRDRYLKQGEEYNLSIYNESENELDMMYRNITRDYSRGLMKSCTFSRDGKYICLSTIDDFILLLSAIQYEIIKVIKLTDSTCKTTAFLPQASSSIMLYILTATCDVVLLDYSNLDVKVMIQAGNTYQMHISNNGKIIAMILKTGEVRLYNTAIGLNSLRKTEHCAQVMKVVKDGNITNVFSLDCDLKRALSRNRLIPILHEFGEYPAKYRHMIWCSLLELPNNSNEFIEILRKGAHPTVSYYDQCYPLKDASALRNLKRTLSCLSYWCKVFGHCDFLPNFVFPFLKIYPNSPLLMFEFLATVLLNHCQLWFEFSPLEPLNYLGMIENLLTEFEPYLANFYKEKEVTAKTYAWSLMSTAFSEVLDEHQWYQLWDNIISNQPEFLLFCIVAYNILQKPIIMMLQTFESIEIFFHDQNIVDVKKLIKVANTLATKCSGNSNPRRYMQKFKKLPKGFYPKFENYPKEWVEMKNNEMETLEQERKLLDRKLQELEEVEASLANRLEEGLKQEEHEKRLKEVEKLYSEALAREEERIACQRKMLLVYHKQIRDRKTKVVDLVRESAYRRNINLHENELDMLIRKIERSRILEETDMLFADENIKIRELNLLSQKYQLENNLMDSDSFQSRFKDTLNKIETEKAKLASELRNLADDEFQMNNVSEGNDIGKKMCEIEKMFKHIQIDFLQTIQHKSNVGRDFSKENKLKELKGRASGLQLEAQKLLQKLN